MSAALDNHELNRRQASDSLPETKLLRYFSGLRGARLIEREPTLLGKRYHLFQASLGDFIGTGRGPTRFIACLKAIAECLERKFMAAAFGGPLSYIPRWKQTSNGFAVHLNMAGARKAARLEAMERHILQTTYFRDGWKGFQALDVCDDIDSGLTLTRLVSRYRCEGLRAGMVIATGRTFPGISVGYLCAEEFGFSSCPKWLHAHFEAVDKIEPMLALREASPTNKQKPIERDLFDWLLNAPGDLSFGSTLGTIELPRTNLAIHDFELMASWRLGFPFFGAFAHGDGVLPLIVSSRVAPQDESQVCGLLMSHGLSLNLPLRNPIL